MGPAWALGLLVAATITDLVFLPEGGCEGCPRDHFLYQRKSECHFLNGTERIRYLERYFYDRQELVRFDSDRGEFEAVATLGEPDAKFWNSQTETLAYKRRVVDHFCRGNYEIDESFLRDRRVQPKVKITPTENPFSSSLRHTLLICNVAGFWPSAIKITWLRNGKEEDVDQVFTTDLIRNGDWTFDMAVMLEAEVEHGDVFACWVEHTSFKEPVTVQWEPDGSRSHMWTGVAGFVLGLLFLVFGLIQYLKAKKGQVIPQPPEALLG